MVKKAGLTLLAMAILAIGSGCSDPLETEERDVFGMEIVDGSENVLAAVNAARQVTGSLSTSLGASTAIDVYFLDSDGDRFQISPAGGEHVLAWEVANESIAEIEASIEGYRLIGKAGGNTSVTFSILHGGHSDYESPAIPIGVVN